MNWTLIYYIFSLGDIEQGLPAQQLLLLQPCRLMWSGRDYRILENSLGRSFHPFQPALIPL